MHTIPRRHGSAVRNKRFLGIVHGGANPVIAFRLHSLA
jgi:hypothetical protein